MQDLYSTCTIEFELSRDVILEKVQHFVTIVQICFLAVSYFCVSTELRFLVQAGNEKSKGNNQETSNVEGASPPTEPIYRRMES